MKTLKSFATIVAMLMCCITTCAQTLVDGIWYNFYSNGTAEVTQNGKYTGNVTIPATVSYNDQTYDVTSIGYEAFYYCSSLTSITIPNSVTSIGYSAFNYCSKLTDVHITSIENWCSITFGDSDSNPLYNGGNLYLNGNLVTEITIPSSVSQIKTYAFYYSGVKITLQSTTPPVLKSTSAFDSNSCFVVPSAAYDDYCSAPYWSNMKTRITKDDMNVKNVALTANSNRSALETEIGEANLRYVTDLTISGTINSYDFMVMRNKMTMLRNLDLSEATIVANKYEHYTNYCTEDNKFPEYGLYNCKLNTLILPKNIESIGSYAIAYNMQLREVEIQKGVITIGNRAFDDCSKLTQVDIPNSVTSIGSHAFYGCSNLKSVEIQKGLVSIGQDCFASCRSLSSIMLPPSITSIGSYAFSGCYSLSEVHLPSSLRSVGDNAFSSCSKLKDVYVYVVEPIQIGQNTFTKSGNNFTSTLHAPKTSYWDYYYNTQWSQFLTFAEFEGTYDNFYLEGDKVLDNETGSIDGEDGKAPDAELGENSGIIVGGDVNQDLGNVDVEHDGENGGSIIVEGEGQVTFENLTFHIKVKGGRWYFFCFPFDVRKGDVKCENGADWVFRYYDGEERANNGKGGWKNVTSDGNGNFLKAATGYIFQCSKDDVLTLSAKNDKIKQEKKYIELVEHVTENMQDASWNFVGNPYLSYYEITQDDYSAPITVWDGKKYIAIRPGDDSYVLAPFEAFFVQKPNGTNTVNYNPENQMTYNQAQNSGSNARVAGMSNNTQRMLINITLNNGVESDRTRVVFNDNANMAYELECDASKFSTEDAIQIYTMNADNVMYAINERPMAQGCVNVGYSVPAQGKYTIEAPRQDIGVLLMDNITGEVHDLTKGAYEFASEAGTFNNRFMLIAKGDATAIEKVDGAEDGNATWLYNIKGQRVKTMEQGEVYIKNNVKVTKN